MFGTGESFSDQGIAFSRQFVDLYTFTIGKWSYLMILSAAFATLTCVDGYPRSPAACCSLIGNLRPHLRRRGLLPHAARARLHQLQGHERQQRAGSRPPRPVAHVCELGGLASFTLMALGYLYAIFIRSP